MSARFMRWFGAATACAAMAVSASASAQTSPADERVLGTWLLNVTKSKFTPGPAYKHQIRTYERRGDGIKATLKTTYADGRTATVEYVANYDSLEYPVSGSTDYESIRLKKIDASTSEAVLGHAGNVFATARRVIAEDGKSMTITFQANEVLGNRFRNVMVYDRQQ